MKAIPAVLAAPWAIEPGWLRVVFGVWSRGQLEIDALNKARAEWEARRARGPRLEESGEAGAPIEGGGGILRAIGTVAVVSIDGPLFRHASLISDFSGGTSYDAIARAIEVAEQARGIESILLRINSPGGEADGCNELAKRIAASSKPVRAHVDGMCASAALWLASQADRITAEETAEIGSIGVRVGLVDDSRADELAGVRQIEIVSSQSPGKRSRPVDDDVIGRVQVRIDDLADIFVGAVARGRGVSPETVLEEFGGGDVMIASKAEAVGLIDGIASFSEALGQAAGAPTRKVAMMAKEPKAAAAAPLAGEMPEWKCSACDKMQAASAKAYCAECFNEEDEDEDEEDAKALGLEPGASLEARRMRAASLVALEAQLLEAAGVGDRRELLEAVKAGAAARGKVAELERTARRVELRAVLERGVQGAPGQAPKLSQAALERSIPAVLRGASKRGWVAAMSQLAAAADEAKTSIGLDQVIAAACSVDLEADDLEAVREFVESQAPIAAPTFAAPARDGVKEAEERDEMAIKIKAYADNARRVMDRNNNPAAK